MNSSGKFEIEPLEDYDFFVGPKQLLNVFAVADGIKKEVLWQV